MFDRLPPTRMDRPSGPAPETGPRPSAAPPPSETLPRPFGRYMLLREVGRGGMGVVFEAMDTHLHRRVALKALLEGNEDAVTVERLQREARATAQLRHPNIVEIYDVGEADSVPYLTMNFVDGQTLADRMAATSDLVRQGKLARLVFHKSIEILRDVSVAVGAAHALGIVHRDLKPCNVLLDGNDTPFVTDFGLAKEVRPDRNTGDQPTITLSGTILGTPGYMSPEQARGDKRSVTPRSDVFSLGVVLYELICGKSPFEGESLYALLDAIAKSDPAPPRQVAPCAPRDLETICLRCLEKDPDRRYANGDELALDLTRFLYEQPIVARSHGALYHLRRRIERNRPAAMAFALLGILVGAGSIWYPLHRAARQAEGEKYLVAAAASDDAGKCSEALSQLELARDRLGERPDLMALTDAVRRHATKLEEVDAGDGVADPREVAADRILDGVMHDLLLSFMSLAQGSREVSVRNSGQALEGLGEAEDLVHDYYRIHYARGLCQYRLWQARDPHGDLGAAAVSFEKALDRCPQHVASLQGLLEVRIAALREAWTRLPGTWEVTGQGVRVAWEGWGEASTTLGELAEGCRARLSEVAAEDLDRRDQVYLQWVEGALLACEGQMEEALAQLGRVDDPPDLAASARQIEGECMLSQEGRADEAARRFAEGRRFGGDSLPLLAALGRAYAQDGDWEEAARTWERLVELRPDVREWRAHLGLALILADREEEGRPLLEQALQEGLPEGAFRSFVLERLR